MGGITLAINKQKTKQSIDPILLYDIVNEIHKLTNPKNWNRTMFEDMSRYFSNKFNTLVGIMEYDPSQDGIRQIMVASSTVNNIIVDVPTIQKIYKDLLFSAASLKCKLAM